MTKRSSSTAGAAGNQIAGESGAKIPRVLHLSATNFFGGPEKQIIGHALAVDRQRYAIIVTAFSERGQETELVRRARDSGLIGRTIPVYNAYDPRATRRIARLMAGEHIDILVTHNYRSHLLGRRAARTLKIRHIAVSRGWTTENLKVRFYHWLDKKTLHKSDLIVCVSQNKMDELRVAGVPEARLVVIPNAVDVDQEAKPTVDWRRKFGWGSETQLVVSAGRLSVEKGPDLFLAAINEIWGSFPSARFIIFGEGPMAGALSQRIEEANLAAVVRMAGNVPHLGLEMAAFDVLVNPSRLEGLPNVVLEAMAARLPVVATAVGGVGELIADGQTGRLVSPQPAALAQAVSEVLADPQQAIRRAEQAREAARTRFSFARQARRYEQIYDRLLADQESTES